MLKYVLLTFPCIMLTSCAMEPKESQAAKAVRIRTIKGKELETYDITNVQTILDLKRKLNSHEYAVSHQMLVAVGKIPWTFGLLEKESDKLDDNQSIREVMARYNTDLFQSYIKRK